MRLPYTGIHLLDQSLWSGAGWSRSRELTPLFLDRYTGPRQVNKLTHHDCWELTCVMTGSGKLICDTTVELLPGMICLVPPGMPHIERADGNLDTIWIGLKGRSLSKHSANHSCQAQNQALVRRVEELWLFAIRRTGPIGPELDALTAGIVACFFRLLSEGAMEPEAADALERAVVLFQRQFDRKLSIAEIARRLGYSTGHFCRSFKQRTGHTPVHYLTRVRLQHARRLLEYTELPIRQVANQAGYEDQFFFSRVFRKAAGMTPSEYRRQVRSK